MEPQVTALRVLKNLDYMNLQELVATLKVHGQEIKKDEEFKKGKFVALSTQTERKTPSSKESSSRPSSKSVYKALSVEYFSVVEFKEESDEDDELAFIARKIRKMWKNKNGSRWKNFSKKVFKEKKDTRKSSIICYECKKPGHFKSECPKLEKSKESKSLMSTSEDLDEPPLMKKE